MGYRLGHHRSEPCKLLKCKFMTIENSTLGDVSNRIYDFPFWGGVYLPQVDRYESSTPCIVVAVEGDNYAIAHQECLERGFKNWLNIAVISDTCDTVADKNPDNLVAAFNEDCKPGNWLAKNMTYLKK
jgi:hypothetical protein